MFKDTAIWNCQPLDLAKMSQNIKKALRCQSERKKLMKRAVKSICLGFGGNLVGRWIPRGHMQASVPLICHLEQWIQTQGFPLDTKKSIIASRPSVLYIHSIPPAQPALHRPVHLEKPINLIVSLQSVQPVHSQEIRQVDKRATALLSTVMGRPAGYDQQQRFKKCLAWDCQGHQ